MTSFISEFVHNPAKKLADNKNNLQGISGHEAGVLNAILDSVNVYYNYTG